jgi:hypothetical protein
MAKRRHPQSCFLLFIPVFPIINDKEAASGVLFPASILYCPTWKDGISNIEPIVFYIRLPDAGFGWRRSRSRNPIPYIYSFLSYYK